jgi:tRNA(fMet)-specific endonuclease VapC
VAIPIIALYEIEAGIAKSAQPQKRRNQLGLLLAAVRVLPFDMEAARKSAMLRAAMEAKDTPLGPMDTLIAGIALAHRATLVTNNTREFSRVPSLELDNWV